MIKNFFDELDGNWMDIISDTYNNENVYIVKPVTNEKNDLITKIHVYKDNVTKWK